MSRGGVRPRNGQALPAAGGPGGIGGPSLTPHGRTAPTDWDRRPQAPGRSAGNPRPDDSCSPWATAWFHATPGPIAAHLRYQPEANRSRTRLCGPRSEICRTRGAEIFGFRSDLDRWQEAHCEALRCPPTGGPKLTATMAARAGGGASHPAGERHTGVAEGSLGFPPRTFGRGPLGRVGTMRSLTSLAAPFECAPDAQGATLMSDAPAEPCAAGA